MYTDRQPGSSQIAPGQFGTSLPYGIREFPRVQSRRKMDEMQRKLALIDNELAGRTLRGRLASTAPLFLPAVGLMAGILLQEKLTGRLTGVLSSALPWAWLAAAVPAGTIVLAARIRSRLQSGGARIRRLLLLPVPRRHPHDRV